MKSPTISTINKLLASLPEEKKEQVLNKLYEYILDLYDEMKWNNLFKETQSELNYKAKRLKENIDFDSLEDFDYTKL